MNSLFLHIKLFDFKESVWHLATTKYHFVDVISKLLLHQQLHQRRKQLIMQGFAVFLLMWALAPSETALIQSAHH